MTVGGMCALPATQLATLIGRGEVSPVEVITAVLDRIAAINPALGAYVSLDADGALSAARAAEQAVRAGATLGKLHGVPVSIKDNIWMAGHTAAAGSRLLRSFRAPEDSPVVTQLRRAGAIIVGRTNMPEFAWRGTTEGPLHPPARNPWNTALTAGGSSGGAAGAVAAGLGPLAIGTDGAGSIRLPASFCGVVGFKPTFGRIAHYPAARANELVSHIGPMARSVADCALLFHACAGYDRRDPWSVPPPTTSQTSTTSPNTQASNDGPTGRRDLRGLRVAWAPTLGGIPADPEAITATRRTVQHIATLGAAVDQVTPDLAGASDILDTLYGSAQAAMHGTRPVAEKAQMDQDLVGYAEQHLDLSANQYLAAVEARQALVDTLRRFFDGYDLLVTPTCAVLPFELGQVNPPTVAGVKPGHLDWTLCYPFNFSGQPAISLPAGLSTTGLPIGVQLVGRKHADELVLAAAAAIEQIAPWCDTWPDELHTGP